MDFFSTRVKGLHEIINNLPGTISKVTVVFAQCFGGYMADDITVLRDTFPVNRLCNVIGLSYEKTHRVVFPFSRTISTFATHYELSLWFAKTYGDEDMPLRVINEKVMHLSMMMSKLRKGKT